ncbi:MAG: PilZ domain-containing protein [Magnetococcus sp. YQC-9]
MSFFGSASREAGRGKGGVERRRVPRYGLRALVTLRLVNGAMTQGTLRDMSTQGAFVRLQRLPFGLEVGEEGMFCLVLPGETAHEHRFSCEIPRVSAEGVAVRFMTGD